MSKRLDHEEVNENISNMWAALWHNQNAPDYDAAVEDARKVEANLREQLRKQDALDEAAPDLLEALKECREWYEKTGAAILSQQPDKPTPICFSKALGAIQKAEQ